jgi:hypothetical protein
MMALLLQTFPIWLGIGVLGGIALILARFIIVLPGSRSLDDAPEAARSVVIVAGLWSIAMSIYLAVSTGVLHGGGLAILWLGVPPVLSLLPLRTERVRPFALSCGICALVLSVFSFISGFSIGAAYPLSCAFLVVGGFLAYMPDRYTSSGATLPRSR